MDFFAVKVDGSDVIAGISITDSRYDITSVNFYSENVHEDDIFVRQNILQFFSGESKDYKYLKSSQTYVMRTLNLKLYITAVERQKAV